MTVVGPNLIMNERRLFIKVPMSTIYTCSIPKTRFEGVGIGPNIRVSKSLSHEIIVRRL